MEYLLTFGNVDGFNIEMNAIKGHLRNVFFFVLRYYKEGKLVC